MTELLSTPFDTDIGRQPLYDHLAAIDSDKLKLQKFINELYHGAYENPQVLYAAAVRLIALTYLEHRNEKGDIILPSREESLCAFDSYIQLISMINIEKDAPGYAQETQIVERLMGIREEVLFNAVLTYACAEGSLYVALPSRARVDFSGAEEASDIQIFFPDKRVAGLEVQVTYHPSRRDYHPRIAVLNLATALGNRKATELRGVLRDISNRTDCDVTQLPEREHAIILDGANSIMKATLDWNSAEELAA